jgi:hypothetical protein
MLVKTLEPRGGSRSFLLGAHVGDAEYPDEMGVVL